MELDSTYVISGGRRNIQKNPKHMKSLPEIFVEKENNLRYRQDKKSISSPPIHQGGYTKKMREELDLGDSGFSGDWTANSSRYEDVSSVLDDSSIFWDGVSSPILSLKRAFEGRPSFLEEPSMFKKVNAEGVIKGALVLVMLSSIGFSLFVGISITDSNLNGKLRSLKFGSEKRYLDLKRDDGLINYDLKDEDGNLLGGKRASIQFAHNKKTAVGSDLNRAKVGDTVVSEPEPIAGRPEPEPEIQRAPRPEPHAEPEPNKSKVPRPEPQAEPEPSRTRAPRPEPQAEPEPSRARSPRPEPKAEPEPSKAEARPEPHSEPEPRSEPESRATRVPKPEPNPEPEPVRNAINQLSILELSQKIEELNRLIKDDVESDESEFDEIETEIQTLKARKRNLIKKLLKSSEVKPLDLARRKMAADVEYGDLVLPEPEPKVVKKVKAPKSKVNNPLTQSIQKPLQTRAKSAKRDKSTEDNVVRRQPEPVARPEPNEDLEDRDYPDDPKFRGKDEI